MKTAWKKIERLIKENAQHRRGFRLKEISMPFILEQAQEEMNELRKDPDSAQEMADLLGILIHYSIKQGWTMELLQSCLIEKLNLRFKEK